MTLREKIVDHISRTVSSGEANEAHILLGLLIMHFTGCATAFVDATTVQLSEFLHLRYNAVSTIARRLSTMRLIFAVLVEWGLVDSNPATGVERPSVADKSTDFDVSSADVDALIEFQHAFTKKLAKSTGEFAHHQRVVLAMIHLIAGGAFLSEIESLEFRDLRSEAIIVGRGTDRERPLWLPKAAFAAIEAAAHAVRVLPPAPNEALLVSRGGTLNTKKAWYYFHHAIRRAGMADTGLTAAKAHRAAANAIVERGLGWSAARHLSGYRQIPRSDAAPPSVDEMERAIARCHPLEFV